MSNLPSQYIAQTRLHAHVALAVLDSYIYMIVSFFMTLLTSK